MKLTDLNPRWVIDADIMVGGQVVHNAARRGMGMSFDCPCCRKVRLGILFANPVDGGIPSDDGKLWQRVGDSFETIRLFPSIDASAHGHWHGFITDGLAV